MSTAASAAPASELIAGAWLVPIDHEPIRGGGVVIADGVITNVGPREELSAERASIYEGAVVLPGFVNAHSHLEYASFAGFGDGLDFGPWIELHMKRKQRLGPSELLDSARLGVANSLASGITTTGDASFSGVAAGACAELGLRAIVCLEVFGSDATAARERFDELREPFDRRTEPADHRGEPLIQLGVSPHAPYTTGPAVYRWAQQLGLPVSTHVAESPHEQEFMLTGSGPIQQVAAMCDVHSPATTTVRHFAQEELLDETVTAAHCVMVDDEEIELLAQAGTGVAHCPRSNAQLGCGIAPLTKLIERGVAVGIGTDSPASAPDFDMFAEMRAAVAAARSEQGSSSALRAREVLELATLGSARALNVESQLGSLTPGKQADVAVVGLEDSPYAPIEDPESAVVYGGSPERILRTITGGNTRYEPGGFEWHELREAARAARARMLEVSVTAAT
jgi:5-methylthioadenosine/S-adenosylhomocysteine deaminase